MKKQLLMVSTVVLAFLLVASSVPAASPIEQADQPKADTKAGRGIGFGLRLYGGMNWLVGGELSDGIAGFVQYYEHQAESAGNPYESVSRPLHACVDAGVDLMIHLGERFGLSLGAAYLSGKQQSGIDIQRPLHTFSVDFNRKVDAIPVTLGLFYALPISRSFSLVAEAGGGYAFARLNMEQLATAGLETANQYSEGRAGGLNLYARLGVEAEVVRNVFVFAEILGRYAKLSSFEGKAEIMVNGVLVESIDGAFYSFDLNHDGRVFHILDFGESAWENPGVSNAHLAQVDFSGVSVRGGFRIGF